jgi:hypothetical protein
MFSNNNFERTKAKSGELSEEDTKSRLPQDDWDITIWSS